MACNCADEIDEKLKDRNTQLSRGLVFARPKGQLPSNNPNLIVDTYQIEKGRGKAKATVVFISFCPFCGVEYDAE